MCGGSTTVTQTPAPLTDAQQQQQQLQLQAMQQQNDLLKASLPGQTANIELQNKLIQAQLDNLPNLTAEQNQQMALAQAQLQAQINQTAMQTQLQPLQLQYLTSQNQLAMQQVQALKTTTDQQAQQNTYILAGLKNQYDQMQAFNAQYTPEEQAAAQVTAAKQASEMGAIQLQAAQIQLKNLQQGTTATPEEAANINAAYDAMEKQGSTEISNYLTQTLRQVNEQTSQAAGLRPTDTPITSLSEQAAAQAATAQGSLTNQTESQRAQAMLNYPLAVSQLQGQQAANLQSISGGASAFSQQLQANANASRASTFSAPQFAMPQSAGFATPQSAPAANIGFAYPQQQPMTNYLGMNMTQPMNTTTQQPWYAGLQSVGQMMSGAGAAVGALAMFSDVRLKKDVKRIGSLDSGLPVYSFKYKGTEVPRIGVMAQETARLFPDAVHRHSSGFLTVDHARIA